MAEVLGHGEAVRERPGIILVARGNSRVIGFGVHEICGVIAIDGDRRTVLDVTEGGVLANSGIVSAAFSTAGHSGVILDVDALASLPGVPLAEDRLVSSQARRDSGRPVLTVSVGGYRLGLPAGLVEASVPCLPRLSCPVDDPVWLGRISYNGANIAVVDPLAILGLGAGAPGREIACVLLGLGEGRRVALYIDAVIDLLRIHDDQEAGLQGLAIGGGLIRAILQSQSPVILLDGEALAAQDDVRRLAGLEERARQPSGDERSGGGALAQERQPFLIFRLGEGAHAVPLGQVTEILRREDCALIPMPDGGAVFSALISHRGRAVPIVDLGARMNIPSRTAPAYIMLATDGERSAGFLFNDLCAVERLVVRSVSRMGRCMGQTFEAVVTTGDGKSCQVYNLADMIGAMHVDQEASGVLADIR